MGKQCCAYNCSQTFEKNSSISFHAFPRDPARRKLWTINLKRINFVPSDYTRICSMHFTEDCFDREKLGGRWLKPTAVPTVFSFLPNTQNKDTSLNSLQKISTHTGHLSFQKQQIPNCKDATSLSETVKTAKRKRLSYLGDFKSGVMNSPEELEKRWKIATRLIQTQKKKIHRLQKRHKRLEKKVADLSFMLQESKQKEDCVKDALEIPGVAGELLKRVSNNILKDKYSSELQNFASKLHHFSPKAYDYVRKVFNTCLPHPSTLRKWCAIEKGKPGLTMDTTSLHVNKQMISVSNNLQEPTCRVVRKQNETRNSLQMNEGLITVRNCCQKFKCKPLDNQNEAINNSISNNGQGSACILLDNHNEGNSLGRNEDMVTVRNVCDSITCKAIDNPNECDVILTEL